MTEYEWLECPYPQRLIEGKGGWRRSTRKLRLLTCACYRRIWSLLSEGVKPAIDVAERHADSRATNDELKAIQPSFKYGGGTADNGVYYATASNRCFRSWVGQAISFAAWHVEVQGPKHDAERLGQCHLVREVFGPLRFRSILLSPNCRTGIVTELAQVAYDNRDLPNSCFDVDCLAVLSDALEDAGCDNTDILDHLRSPGPHVRGCWVVDLILGKQ